MNKIQILKQQKIKEDDDDSWDDIKKEYFRKICTAGNHRTSSWGWPPRVTHRLSSRTYWAELEARGPSVPSMFVTLRPARGSCSRQETKVGGGDQGKAFPADGPELQWFVCGHCWLWHGAAGDPVNSVCPRQGSSSEDVERNPSVSVRRWFSRSITSTSSSTSSTTCWLSTNRGLIFTVGPECRGGWGVIPRTTHRSTNVTKMQLKAGQWWLSSLRRLCFFMF